MRGGGERAEEAVDDEAGDEHLALLADGARPLVADAGDEGLQPAELQPQRPGSHVTQQRTQNIRTVQTTAINYNA